MASYRLTDELGQFTAIPERVVEMIPEIGSDAALMYLYLRYRTNAKRGQAWPGYKRMRKDLTWGRTRIHNAIKALEEHALLDRQQRFGQSTIYMLKRPPDVGVETEGTPISPIVGLIEESAISPNLGLHSSHSGTPLVPKRDLNQIKFNQNESNQTQIKELPLSNNEKRKLAEEYFRDLTGLRPNGDKSDPTLWWQPLKHICEVAGWNATQINFYITAGFERNVENDWQVSSPKSIVKSVNAIKGEINTNRYKRGNQPKGVAGMSEFLKGA
jgi:hypothetical protein